MRLYMGDASRKPLAKCRERAPEHSYGVVWTPEQKRNGTPYIVDNGVYQAAMRDKEWSASAWTELLDTVTEHPWPPDFVVLPDVYNDAEATLERHRKHADEVLSRGLRPAAVIQPGMDVQTQIELADRIGAGVAFVGGENRWKRSVGAELVTEAHARDMAVHIGNPGVPGGLAWAQGIGADSLDTASIVASGAYHHLDEMEGITRGCRKKGGYQGDLSGVFQADD
jgi:hypothetical protein